MFFFEPDRTSGQCRESVRTSRRLRFRSVCKQPHWWREFLQGLGAVPTRGETAMVYFRRTRLFRLVVLPLMLVSFLSGCYKWVELEPPYSALAGRQTDDQANFRVTVTDSRSHLFFSAVRVQADSLIGTRWEIRTERTALPLHQVQRLEINEKDELKTAVGGILVLGGLVLVLSQLCIEVLFNDCRD